MSQMALKEGDNMNEHCAEFGMLSAIACDHAMNPRNNGPLDRFDGNARITGPCGDTMEFWIVVQDGLVKRFLSLRMVVERLTPVAAWRLAWQREAYRGSGQPPAGRYSEGAE
jgi:hypothetical protein